MSVRYINWAFNQNLKSPMQKLVLVKIADNADDSGLAWPALETIAKFTCANEKTVRRAISELSKKGLMTIRKMPAQQNHKRNQYQLHMEVVLHYEKTADESQDIKSTDEEVSPDSLSNVTGLSVHSHRSESPDNHQLTVNESSDIKDIVPSKDDTLINDAFESIWSAYPKRNGAKGSKQKTKTLCKTICKTREEWEGLYKTVCQYRKWADHNGKTSTDMIMQTTTFFGKQKQGYLEDWSINPVQPNRNNQLYSPKPNARSLLQEKLNGMVQPQEKEITGEVYD